MGYRPLTVSLRNSVAALLAAMMQLSCGESPVESRLRPGQRIQVGQIIEGAVDADSFSVYSFVAAPQRRFVVLLEAIHGHLFLSVYDSTHQYTAATLEAAAGGLRLDQNPTAPFGTATGGIYRLLLYAIPSGSAPDFRLQVFAIDTKPERVSDAFAFGDTVTGETMEPPADLDWFHVSGVAGQEVVAVVEPLDRGRSGSMALTVSDTVTNDFLGSVSANAGASSQRTTGRLQLPATRDYLFAFATLANGIDPPYTGPYRFWSYVIDRAPEHQPYAIAVNTEIKDERIDRAGDVDEFVFQATAETDYNVFVQAAGPPVLLEVGPVNGTPVETALSQASDTGLFNHPTNRLHVATAGSYVVRLSGYDPYQVADTGAYRIYVYAIDRQPEHVAASITPGDTVAGEDIGLPGDIDEFTFTGDAGEAFNAFLQGQTGSSQTHLQLDVVDQAGTVLQSTQSLGNDTDLLSQVTGRFALPTRGTYRLRVSGIAPYGDDLNRGPYRLALYRIDPRPETLNPTLAFGDSLSGEAIDLPGDVDEFRVVVPDSSGANLAFEFEGQSPSSSEFRVGLVDSVRNAVVVEAATVTTGTRTATGRLALAPGHYIVRVQANDYYHDRRNWQGSYRLWLYRFAFGPEIVPDSFTLGDTVSGETIEPWGDMDRFHFYATRSQHLNLLVQGLGPSQTGLFQVFMSPPGTPPGAWPSVELSIPNASPGLDNQTTRLDLPATGWYELLIGGGGFNDRGPYRFTVQSLEIGPEHGNAIVSAGDSVSEQIDVPGDWDEYAIAAPAGQDFEVFFDGRTVSGPFAYLRVIDPATGDTLAGAPGQLVHIVGPFRVPSSGQAHIAVFEPGGFARFCSGSCDPFRMVGPFAFKLVAVDLGPENLPASYTVGDTVRGETISPVGDVDQFTASGTPGEQLTPYFRLTQATTVDSALALEIIDPATGAILWGNGAAWIGTSFGTYASFTVPAGGTFRVRVRAYRFFQELGFGTGGYEFFVKRGP